MLRIAVCDDENVICSQVERYLNDSAEKFGIGIETDVFYSGEAFIDLAKKNFYDVVFLDLNLGVSKSDGMNVSRILREELKNENTHIVYISGYSDYAYKLFDFDPLMFLKKPILKEDIEKAFAKIMKRMNIRAESSDAVAYEFKSDGEVIKKELKDIVYFESNNRKLKIFTSDGEFFYCYGKIKDIYEQLKEYGFIMVHNSFVINYAHILNFHYDHVVMKGNITVPISQPKRKEIRTLVIELFKK